jgi:hypothetical protein
MGELDRCDVGFYTFAYGFSYFLTLERDWEVAFSLPSVLTLKILTFDLPLSLELDS